MAEISTKPWSSISASDYADADDYCGACLVDLNDAGRPKVKAQCYLPVYEPKSMGRALNRNGVTAAAARLAGAGGGVDVPVTAKKSAARKLSLLYVRIKLTLPDSIRSLAR